MLHSEPETSANRNIMKFAAAAAATALLAGCAVVVPLPPFTTSSKDSRYGDFACRPDPSAPMEPRTIGLLIAVRSPLAPARLTTIHPISF
jgi:hypothetical protein